MRRRLYGWARAAAANVGSTTLQRTSPGYTVLPRSLRAPATITSGHAADHPTTMATLGTFHSAQREPVEWLIQHLQSSSAEVAATTGAGGGSDRGSYSGCCWT